MSDKLINLTHLHTAVLESKALSSQVAAAAAEAIEELAASAVTMEQVNQAIEAAISQAIGEAY